MDREWLSNGHTKQLHRRDNAGPECNLPKDELPAHWRELDANGADELIDSNQARLCDHCARRLR